MARAHNAFLHAVGCNRQETNQPNSMVDK